MHRHAYAKGSVHTMPEKFENAALFLRSVLPSTLSLLINRLLMGPNEPREPVDIREITHDVYGRPQTAKITSDFLFFSCNP